MISRRKDRREEQAFVVQGEVLVREAVHAGFRIRFLLLRDGFRPSTEYPGVDSYVLDAATFDRINDTATPQGMLAVVEMPTENNVVTDETAWYLVAHGLADPGNLGTLVRSAEAAGASGVIVTEGTVDPYSPKTVRASAGALFHVPVIEVRDLVDPLLNGVTLIGTTSHMSENVEDLWSTSLGGCIGVVLGGEAHGLNPDAPVARWVSIPHHGRSESLNVAMAATVIAMEIGRTRARRQQSPAQSSPSPAGQPD